MNDSQTLLYDMRDQLLALRRQFGSQPWLTVVSGVTAEAYRISGLSGEQFGNLLDAEMKKRQRLIVHLRRKLIMQLRTGFDGADGCIVEKDGLALLNLHFAGGSYMEASPLDDERPALQISRPPTALFVTGGYNRPVSTIASKLPRCLHPRSIRGGEVRRCRWGDQAIVVVTSHWETLALMPEDIASKLGLEPQRSLDHLPWFGTPTLRRELAIVPPDQARVRGLFKPALHLVSTR